MGERTWCSLGVLVVALLAPAAASAAGASVRAFNAAPSGTVSFRVDGKARATGLAVRAESKRFALTAGQHTVTVTRAGKVLARRSLLVAANERVTLVYALSTERAADVRVLREPAASGAGTGLRVANYAGGGGPVDVLAGPLTIARAVGYGQSTLPRRLTGALSPTGLATIAVRTRTGTLVRASAPLVLATRSVGIFVLVPTASGRRLVRLRYDTAPPTPTAQPAITGRRRVGSTVQCGAGKWTPTGTRVTRSWTIDGTPAVSSPSLKLASATHAGHLLGCTVSARANGMTTVARTTFALPPVPVLKAPPAIIVPADVGVGDLAQCTTGTWTGDPSDFAIRWVRLGSGQVVGTQTFYELTLADNGPSRSLVCQVSASNDGGASGFAQSVNSVALSILPTIVIDPLFDDPMPAGTTFAFFEFAVSGAPSTVSGTLDGNPVEPPCDVGACQVPLAPNTTMSPIMHTFTATAVNGAGSATASYTWTVDPGP